MFEERLGEAMARARRQGRPMALLFLDIDKFKHINDSHGHSVGDEVLKIFATRLSACVRQTDTVARLAGDEFVVILEGLERDDDTEIVAEKILHSMRDQAAIGPLRLSLSTSIGITTFDGDSADEAQLLEQVDSALYRAKLAGRGTFCRWSMMSPALRAQA
jgi:diguanylate cyclase (GGDEF)-like protein